MTTNGPFMTGVIVGRFQVPYLHPGHLWLIATALRECREVVILLGSMPKREPGDPNLIRNPYDYNTRYDMIHRIFPSVTIVPLWDEETDEQWNRNLEWKLSAMSNPVLYHSRDSFKSSYTGRYPLVEVKEIEGYSGTKLRENGGV